ncbi:hypothetical protein RHMOL_Rhmol03G0107100 [Rhododendron molle]|uniref:Uncharacterized protein n=1 Tax=Rhododendron molle TaxID=49168 RepID=A0ACC0PE23_RHOML|nr:hypothetical protein RHMOL_Rhmol03G0107100 [Rhododendron molle]
MALVMVRRTKPWNGESAQEERFAWVSCFGMPLNVWNVPSFRRIASIWGHFIEVDDNTLREVSFEKGRVLIATEKSCKIEGKGQLIVEGKRVYACHARKDNHVLVAQGLEGQQTKVQKLAEISNQEVVEESNKEEKSHSTQGLDSVVQDSVDPGIESEEERISLLNKDHQREAQVIESAEVIRQQQEIETNALAVNSPVEIDSNVRGSQIQGINLHVDFRVRDTKKGSRNARRPNLYELSQSYEDNNEPKLRG